MSETKLLLVKANALPDTFLKVLEAKQLLASKEAKNASEATKLCGISRSAFYKYKDCVFEYSNQGGQIISLHAVLKDKSGVLSKLLSVLYENKANILTVNQGLPASSVASVSVSIKVDDENFNLSALLQSIAKVDGVVSVEQIIG